MACRTSPKKPRIMCDAGDTTRSIDVILSVLDPLSPPIYQCENGHIMCDSCYSCAKIQKICPSCSCPMGSNRCRAIEKNRCRVMEKIVESIKIVCSNKPRGCAETISYSNKLAHEKVCHYAPCWCPSSGCDYVDSWELLNQHFWDKHSLASIHFDFDVRYGALLDNRKYFFLQEKMEKTVVVMTRHVESRGSLLSIFCIAPTGMKGAFSYHMRVIKGDSMITMTAAIECVSKWTGEEVHAADPPMSSGP